MEVVFAQLNPIGPSIQTRSARTPASEPFLILSLAVPPPAPLSWKTVPWIPSDPGCISGKGIEVFDSRMSLEVFFVLISTM